jgi:hypothetical protein
VVVVGRADGDGGHGLEPLLAGWQGRGRRPEVHLYRQNTQ